MTGIISLHKKETIPLEKVNQHNRPGDLWVIIDKKVYDLTIFKSEHPGGEEVLENFAGQDASRKFAEVGHSSKAKKMMNKYYIGDLERKKVKTRQLLHNLFSHKRRRHKRHQVAGEDTMATTSEGAKDDMRRKDDGGGGGGGSSKPQHFSFANIAIALAIVVGGFGGMYLIESGALK